MTTVHNFAVSAALPYGARLTKLPANRTAANGRALESWDLFCEKPDNFQSHPNGFEGDEEIWFKADKCLTTIASFRQKILDTPKDGEMMVNLLFGAHVFDRDKQIIDPFRVTDAFYEPYISDGTVVMVETGGYAEPYYTFGVYAFHVFFVENHYSEAGGNDLHNDCLWTCTRRFTNYQNLSTKGHITRPDQLKKALGLARNDKIPLALMPKVEELLHVNINVFGNLQYTSPMSWSSKDPINIKLEDGHYELLDPYKGNYLKGFVFNTDRKVLFYHREIDTVLLETGETLTNLEFKNYFKAAIAERSDTSELPSKLSLQQMYKPILDHLHKKLRPNRSDTSEPEHTPASDMIYYRGVYEEVRAALKKPTKSYNHWMELDHCGGLIPTSLSLFHDLSYSLLNNPKKKNIIDIESRSKLEDEWLSKCFYGGIIYSKKGTYENANQWDTNSQYPWVMLKQAMPINVPVPVSERSTRQNVLGIYKIEVSPEALAVMQKCPTFVVSKHSVYTTFDLRTLDNITSHLGEKASYKVINGIEYETARIFDDFVLYMNELKDSVVSPGAKLYVKFLRNLLWGYFSKKNKKKTFVSTKEGAKVEKFDPQDKIYEIRCTKDPNRFKFKSRRNDELVFANAMGRVGAFITAYARHVMNRVSQPFELRGLLLRIHTDSVVLSSPIGKAVEAEFEAHLLSLNSKEIPQYLRINTGIDPKEIGFFKKEKEGHLEVKHSNSLKWSPGV